MPRTLTFRSRLHANPTAVWEHATSLAGINYELMPVMRMTAPNGIARLDPDTITVGTPLPGRSWVLAGGLIPIDAMKLRLTELEPGRRFVEQSQLVTQRLWRHERTLTREDDGGCTVTDQLTFEPRVALLAPLVERILRAQFGNRHRRLRARFGSG